MSRRVFIAWALALIAACAKTPVPEPVTTIVEAQRPAQVVRNPHVSNELLERCRRDAHDWYKRVWEDAPKPPGGVLTSSNYTYGARQGHCLIVVDSSTMSTDKRTGKTTSLNSETLTDLLETRDLAAVKSVYTEGTTEWSTTECAVNGTRCGSRDEWDSLTKRYMEE